VRDAGWKLRRHVDGMSVVDDVLPNKKLDLTISSISAVGRAGWPKLNGCSWSKTGWRAAGVRESPGSTAP
jgi:hypothetical protein